MLATSASLRSVFDITFDSSDNAYMSEFDGHRIRMVSKVTGIITTVAGTGVQGFSGDGGQALLA